MTDQNYPTVEEALQVATDAGRHIPRDNLRPTRFDGAWVFYWGKKHEGIRLRPKGIFITVVTDSGNAGPIRPSDKSISDAIQRIDNKAQRE